MKKIIYIIMIMLPVMTGCKKFLDAKADQKLAVPDRLEDLQALMNSTTIGTNDPVTGEVSADDFFLESAEVDALALETDRRKYTWQKDHLHESAANGNDWSAVYSLVYLANTVLEGTAKIERTVSNATTHDYVSGQASFYRARAYFTALLAWSLAYDPANSKSNRGIVIREGTDFNKASVRSSQQEGFDQVISDLEAAAARLPVTTAHPSKPAKQAAYALMARVRLYMGDFLTAKKYADSALSIRKDLVDYNTISTTKTYPFTRFNTEVIYESLPYFSTVLGNARARINPILYNSYQLNDLRKQLFFINNAGGTFGFRGSYSGGATLCSPLTTAELFLIRSECNARLGRPTEALDDLNTLLIKRYKAGTFQPYQLSTVADLKSLILLERRKELLMRNLRWGDIKRLNHEGAGINQSRSVNSVAYSLPANDPRYALEIPEDVIANSNIDQNIR